MNFSHPTTGKFILPLGDVNIIMKEEDIKFMKTIKAQFWKIEHVKSEVISHQERVMYIMSSLVEITRILAVALSCCWVEGTLSVSADIGGLYSSDSNSSV